MPTGHTELLLTWDTKGPRAKEDLKGKATCWRASQSDLMQLQKMKIAQHTKSLMTTAPELLVMMVTTEMTLVVVPLHLPHKEKVMSDLSLPSRLTNSHTAPSI
jgi:hypothetical protein